MGTKRNAVLASESAVAGTHHNARDGADLFYVASPVARSSRCAGEPGVSRRPHAKTHKCEAVALGVHGAGLGVAAVLWLGVGRIDLGELEAALWTPRAT